MSEDDHNVHAGGHPEETDLRNQTIDIGDFAFQNCLSRGIRRDL